MIKHEEPISMAEAIEYVEKDSEADIKGFIKKFININAKEAKELKEKLQKNELIKMKPEHIVKIIDILPDNAEDLNKIFSDVSLNEDETKKILDTVKQFK